MPRASSAPPSLIDNRGAPQGCFQKQPESVSLSWTWGAARCPKSRLHRVAAARRRAMQWNYRTKDCEKKPPENRLPTREGTGLSDPARIASKAALLLEYRP